MRSSVVGFLSLKWTNLSRAIGVHLWSVDEHIHPYRTTPGVRDRFYGKLHRGKLHRWLLVQFLQDSNGMVKTLLDPLKLSVITTPVNLEHFLLFRRCLNSVKVVFSHTAPMFRLALQEHSCKTSLQIATTSFLRTVSVIINTFKSGKLL